MGASNGRTGYSQCKRRPPCSTLVTQSLQVQPSEWVPPAEINGCFQWKRRDYKDLGFEVAFQYRLCNSCKTCLSSRNRSIPTPAGSGPKRWVPPVERMGAAYGKDGCLQWNVWEQLMERMGAPNGKNGCLQWKFMGASSGNRVIFYLQNSKFLSKLRWLLM
jgi:hypothetical protein